MKLAFTICLLVVTATLTGVLLTLAFPEPLSMLFSGVIGGLYGWFVFYPMIVWSSKK